MKKVLLGILLGAVVHYVWGMVSWMALPWHKNSMRSLPEERLILDTLKTVVDQPGAYSFPAYKTPEGKMDRAAWLEKYRQGPTGFLVYSPGGRDPMDGTTIFLAILNDLVLAALAMMILALSKDRVRHIVPRALLAASLGVLAAATVHLPYWIWMHFPADMTLVSTTDTCIGFLLMGFALAKFVPDDKAGQHARISS